MAVRRIQKELRDYENNPPAGILLFPEGTDLFTLTAYVAGPEDSPYEDGIFQIALHLPQDYPFKVYSCNINERGSHCLDIDGSAWSPALTIVRLLRCLQSLLDCANPDDPLRPDLARLYKTNRAQYDKEAREWTKRYAINAYGQDLYDALATLLAGQAKRKIP